LRSDDQVLSVGGITVSDPVQLGDAVRSFEPGDVVDVERRDCHRFVEAVSARGPLVERRGQQHEESTAIDRTDRRPERVRSERPVGVEDDRGPGLPEQRPGVDWFEVFTVEDVLGADDGRLVGGNLGGRERVSGGLTRCVWGPRQDEYSALTRSPGLVP
jgi:hypothetical protein